MTLILIVDDALLSRNIVQKILKNEGYKTIEAKDGEEALNLIQEKQPDFIILDLLIPKLDGFQILERLQAQKISIPIVVVTADTQITTKEKCLALGAISVLNKPVKSDNLISIVQSFITR